MSGSLRNIPPTGTESTQFIRIPTGLGEHTLGTNDQVSWTARS
jgi:hypothetical protein